MRISVSSLLGSPRLVAFFVGTFVFVYTSTISVLVWSNMTPDTGLTLLSLSPALYLQIPPHLGLLGWVEARGCGLGK
jgi:hypothetical protein